MAWLDYGQDLDVGGADTSQTVSALDIGAADANRWVLVGITGIPNSATAATSVTVGGVTATAMAALGVSGGASAGYYKAQVPTGTTADVVVTYNGTVFATNIAVARFIGEPLFDESGTDTAVNASIQLTTGTLTVPDNGYVYGLTSWFNVSTSASWFGLTEDFEDVASNVHFSGGSGFFASATSGSLGVEFGTNPSNNDVLLVVVFTLDDVPSGETFDRAAAIASTSSLTASAQVTTRFPRSASMASASSLAANAVVTSTFERAAAMASASGMTASAVVTTRFERAASIAATSAMAASAVVRDLANRAVIVDAFSSFSAGRLVTRGRSASVAATSEMSATATVTRLFTRAAAITATSTLAAAATVDVAPTLVISSETIAPSPKLGLAFPFDPANRAQTIADDGFGYVRIGASWNLIQPDASTWNWAGLDSRVQAIVDAGMEPFLTFASDAAWATSPGDDNSLNDMPDDLADWTTFVGAVADRYDGVVRFYQFANEFAGIDNGSGGWSSTKENLVAYVNAGYAAVKANASGTTVFMGGVASFNLDLVLVNAEIIDGDVVQALSETTSFGFTEEEARSPEADALIADRFTYPVQNVTVDGFSAHLYGNRANDEARIQFLADATGANLFVSTESGAPTWTGTAPTDEAYFTEAVLSTLGALATGLEVVFWFQDYEGGATFYNQHVPLRDDELNPKPNLWGLKTIARHLVDGSRVTKLGDDAYLIRGPASAYIGNWDTIEGSSKFSGITPARTWVLTDYESGTFTEREPLAGEFVLIEANVRNVIIEAESSFSVLSSAAIQRAASMSSASTMSAGRQMTFTRAVSIGAASTFNAEELVAQTYEITITVLPEPDGAITDLQWRRNGGEWRSLGGSTTGTYEISALPGNDIEIRAVTTLGGPASDTKTAP
jgi:hypothetical protein